MKILGSNYGAITKTQEGLAVFSEFIAGSIDVDRMRRISDRVKAIQMAIDGADLLKSIDILLIKEYQGIRHLKIAEGYLERGIEWKVSFYKRPSIFGWFY